MRSGTCRKLWSVENDKKRDEFGEKGRGGGTGWVDLRLGGI